MSAALAEGTRLYNGGIQVKGVRGGDHSVTSSDESVKAVPRVRDAKSFEFGEGKL